jgi:hypothetical protein
VIVVLLEVVVVTAISFLFIPAKIDMENDLRYTYDWMKWDQQFDPFLVIHEVSTQTRTPFKDRS